MGSTIKHTDLSWELPGPRADIDLPLETFERAAPRTRTWAADSGSQDTWILEAWNEDPDRPED